MQALEVVQKLDELEISLLLRGQQGDYSVIEELYQCYSPRAFGLANKILKNKETAEDVVQEAFLRLWKNPTSYDPRRGKFVPWLLRGIHNQCIDQLRRTNHARQYLLYQAQPETEEIITNVADESVNVEGEVWLKMEQVMICQALSQIPTTQRHLIELAFFQGLTHSEIALASGLPPGTVKSRIRQGLLKLKVLMNNRPIRETAAL